MELYKRLGREASSFLSELRDIAASDGRVHKGAFVRNVRQELSCALCSVNSAVYFQSTFYIAQAVGRQFIPGYDSQFDESSEAFRNSVFLMTDFTCFFTLPFLYA